MLGTLPLVQFTEIGFAVVLARPSQPGTSQPGPGLQGALANPEGKGLTGGT